MDEYQLGIPEGLIEEEKIFNYKLPEKFDLNDKKGKKKAKEWVEENIVGRFHNRERRLKNKIWSNPEIDLKNQTAKVYYCKVGQFCVETFEQTGEEFKLDCPVTGNYMVGRNWGDTH